MVKRILVTRRRAAQTQIVTNGKVDTEGFSAFAFTSKDLAHPRVILLLSSLTQSSSKYFQEKGSDFLVGRLAIQADLERPLF
jgi:hypothetical protein